MLEIILLGKSKKNTIFSILAFLLSLTLIPFYSIISGELVLIFLLIINFLIVVSLIINKSGLIPCSRYLFLVSPGFIQLLIFILSSGSISVAILANEYIDIDAGIKAINKYKTYYEKDFFKTLFEQVIEKSYTSTVDTTLPDTETLGIDYKNILETNNMRQLNLCMGC